MNNFIYSISDLGYCVARFLIDSFSLGYQLIHRMTKSELDKSVDLSLRCLAPAQSQMDLFLDTLCARNKRRGAN